jgi:hypothetical protein
MPDNFEEKADPINNGVGTLVVACDHNHVVCGLRDVDVICAAQRGDLVPPFAEQQ